jgi:hypothetical protein
LKASEFQFEIPPTTNINNFPTKNTLQINNEILAHAKTFENISREDTNMEQIGNKTRTGKN